MAFNEKFDKVKDENGIPIIVDGDFVMELISSEEVLEVNTTKEEINQMQFLELNKTDWYFDRRNELGTEVPKEILTERLDIRKKYDDLKISLGY